MEVDSGLKTLCSVCNLQFKYPSRLRRHQESQKHKAIQHVVNSSEQDSNSSGSASEIMVVTVFKDVHKCNNSTVFKTIHVDGTQQCGCISQ